jgi:hypothetical protein
MGWDLDTVQICGSRFGKKSGSHRIRNSNTAKLHHFTLGLTPARILMRLRLEVINYTVVILSRYEILHQKLLSYFTKVSIYFAKWYLLCP